MSFEDNSILNLLIGNLTVSTADLPIGEYWLKVGEIANFNELTGNDGPELISPNSITFTIVPEPTSLLVLGILGVWGLRLKY